MARTWAPAEIFAARLHRRDLRGVLEQPHFRQHGADVLLPGGRGMAAARGLARRRQPAVQPAVRALVAGQRGVQRGVVQQQRGHQLVQRVDGVGVVEAEMRRGRFRAEALAFPDLVLDVARPAEEQGAVGRAGDQHQPGVRFGKAGEVEEIAVVPVRILGVAVADGFRGGRQDGDAAALRAHLVHQALAPGGERGDVVGRQAHGGRGANPGKDADDVYFTRHPRNPTPRAAVAGIAGRARASCYNRGSVIGE